MRTNKKPESILTHGGAKAKRINIELQLRRAVLACLLFEDSFYESGVDIAKRITELVHLNKPEVVAQLAIEARERMKLRHIPLLLVRELARHKDKEKVNVSDVLARVIQRADELSEFVAIYWKDKKQPLSGQVKKGLAKAFTKFNEYNLAKYNRDNEVKLRDVLFLCHAKPKDKEQEEVWKRLIDNKLTVPDTWEVQLSAGKDKKEVWTRLINEEKLGDLAILRNLRNMISADVDPSLIKKAINRIKGERVLPFRFISSAKYAPKYESELEKAMMVSLSNSSKLKGKTVLILDVSGSMSVPLSRKSDLSRLDSAAALAIIVRELCEEVNIYATAGSDSRIIHKTELLPPRHGFSLRDCFKEAERRLGGGGIFLKQVMDYTFDKEKEADRIIVFTDEQDCDRKCNPSSAKLWGKNHYLINVSCEKNGIGYDSWNHIDGFSERILDYIIEFERLNYEYRNNV